VETLGGVIEPSINPDGSVTVNMGAPRFAPADIPFLAKSPAAHYALEVGGTSYEIAAVSMGNPHAVLLVDDVDAAPVALLGAQIEHHPRFPRRVNVGFLQIVDRRNVALRVWERGAGETLACGTGACAAVVTGIRRGMLDVTVSVATRGGKLTVTWAGADAPVMMSGAAARVFDGDIQL
jgi:diaminopimelate epimerase